MLDIEQETVYDRKSLGETQAGRVMMEQLEKKLQKCDRLVEDVEEQFKGMTVNADYGSDDTDVAQIQNEIRALKEEREELRKLQRRYIANNAGSFPKEEENDLGTFSSATPRKDAQRNPFS